MTKEPDFFNVADELMEKLAWVKDATSKDASIRVNEDGYLEFINFHKRYSVLQLTLADFRNLLAVELQTVYNEGKVRVQEDIKHALGCSSEKKRII